MIVVVGWMIVPLAVRSSGATCCTGWCRLAALAGIAQLARLAAKRPATTAVSGRIGANIGSSLSSYPAM
jgi:hypothetical protein